VAKPEWGTKRQCPKCGERFYDLNQNLPLTCVACGYMFEPDVVLKSKQPAPAPEPKVVRKPVKPVVDPDDEDIEDVEIDDDDDEDEDILGDVDDLDDDDDVSDVIEKPRKGKDDV